MKSFHEVGPLTTLALEFFMLGDHLSFPASDASDVIFELLDLINLSLSAVPGGHLVKNGE